MSERSEDSGIEEQRSATGGLRVSLIVAASENNVIGRQGDLPWRLSADLRRFKRLTMGHCLIMGRKTYESIGRPLPGRTTIVLSRNSDDESLGSSTGGNPHYTCSLEDALAHVPAMSMQHDEVFVTGGGQVYRLALPLADRIHLTRVHTTLDGDATFPAIDWNQWQLTQTEKHAADEKNEYDCTFEVWDRK